MNGEQAAGAGTCPTRNDGDGRPKKSSPSSTKQVRRRRRSARSAGDTVSRQVNYAPGRSKHGVVHWKRCGPEARWGRRARDGGDPVARGAGGVERRERGAKNGALVTSPCRACHLRRALASIWRICSWVTPSACATSSTVWSCPSVRPKRISSTSRSRLLSESRMACTCSLSSWVIFHSPIQGVNDGVSKSDP
jgi:hypothetical protein